MQQLFLTSSVSEVARDIADKLTNQEYKINETRLLFTITASEAEEGDLSWLDEDENVLKSAGFQVDRFTITGKTKAEIEKVFDMYDVICFSGGNSFYLLNQVYETDVYSLIKNTVKGGKIYIGVSAGSILAGPDIYITRFLDDISKAPNLKTYKGLSLVDYIIFPHWGTEVFKGLYLQKEFFDELYYTKYPIIFLNNYQYIYCVDDKFQIITVR